MSLSTDEFYSNCNSWGNDLEIFRGVGRQWENSDSVKIMLYKSKGMFSPERWFLIISSQSRHGRKGPERQTSIKRDMETPFSYV